MINNVIVPSSLHLITGNTLYDTADIGIVMGPGQEISYNDVYHTGRQRTDFGTFIIHYSLLLLLNPPPPFLLYYY